jgi:hypothetical protein
MSYRLQNVLVIPQYKVQAGIQIVWAAKLTALDSVSSTLVASSIRTCFTYAFHTYDDITSYLSLLFISQQLQP